MIIKSLIEIAFYGSLLAVRKIGSTLEENLPFSQAKTQKTTTTSVKAISKNEKTKNTQVTQKEKGSKQKSITKVAELKTDVKKEVKKNDPKHEAKIMINELKTKQELYEIAQEIDLEGRSTMNKKQLLKALQEHAKK